MTKSRTISPSHQDLFLKEFFSHRMVLAQLLKAFVPIFKDTDVNTIAYDCIIPAGLSDRIQTDNTDNGNGVVFDIVFRARLPDAIEEREQIIINLEFQNKLNPGYAIVKRGLYYLSKLIVDQKGKMFENSHYNGLRKVMSLWLCPNSPQWLANSVCSYDISEHLNKDLQRGLASCGEDYDLLELKFICLNQERQPETGTGLFFLHTLFNSSLSSEERAEILKRDYSININQEEKEMFDMFLYAEQNGIEKGIEKGRAEGRAEGRAKGRAEGRAETVREIQELIRKGKTLEDIGNHFCLSSAHLRSAKTTKRTKRKAESTK